MNMHTVVDGAESMSGRQRREPHTHHGWIGGGGGVSSARMEN